MRKFIRKFMLPLVAVAMMGLAIYHVVQAHQAPPAGEPVIQPARNPYGRAVAGAGIVEAQTENIAVGSPLPGVVVEVLVQVGQRVELGEPLFRVDDRQQQAERKLREATLASAQAQLARLQQQPRPEELPASEARVREAQENLVEQQDHLARARQLFPGRAIEEETLIRRQQAARVAQEQLARARADLELLKSGAWEADKAVARAAVEQAKAQLQQIRTDLDRLVVRALVAGEVLQVNVRPGEYVGTPPGQALIVLGNVGTLHVRVDIDEHDIPRFRTGASAQAMLRGHPQHKFPLTFVRVEPYVIPKRSLTGDNSERVDTRVLQVVYAIDSTDRPVYVGQQMDVFIQAEPLQVANRE